MAANKRMCTNERAARVAVDLISRSPAKSLQLSNAPMLARKTAIDWLQDGLGRSKSSAYAAIRFAVNQGWLQAVPGLPRYLALGPFAVGDYSEFAPVKIYGESGRVVNSLCLDCNTKFPLSDLCSDCGACADCCLQNRLLLRAESSAALRNDARPPELDGRPPELDAAIDHALRELFGNAVDSVWVL